MSNFFFFKSYVFLLFVCYCADWLFFYLVFRKAGKHFSAFIKFDLKHSLLLDKDWFLFPQMRLVASQLLADAVVGDGSEFIAINLIEPYGCYILEDAHHERQFTPERSTFPDKRRQLEACSSNPTSLQQEMNYQNFIFPVGITTFWSFRAIVLIMNLLI